MEAAEHQVTGLCSAERDAHGFVITHLADHQDVWRLAHGPAQRGREVGRIHAHFHLLDQSGLVRVLVLNRIFNRDDVPGFASIDAVDQGREGGGLARSGRRQSAPIRDRRGCHIVWETLVFPGWINGAACRMNSATPIAINTAVTDSLAMMNISSTEVAGSVPGRHGAR